MDAGVRAQLDAAETLRKAMDALRFAAPVACVYNPLDYAWNAFRAYVERYGSGPKRTLINIRLANSSYYFHFTTFLTSNIISF